MLRKMKDLIAKTLLFDIFCYFLEKFNCESPGIIEKCRKYKTLETIEVSILKCWFLKIKKIIYQNDLDIAVFNVYFSTKKYL